MSTYLSRTTVFAFAVVAILRATVASGVEIETALGKVEVAPNPAKVVVFDLAALDDLDALDVQVAGTVDELYMDYLRQAGDGAISVGTLFEPDLETLASLAPDLIVAGGRSADKVEAMQRVASTIDMTIWGDNIVEQAKSRITAYGTIFDQVEEAAVLNARLDQKFAATRIALAGKGNAMIVLTNGSKVSAYGDDSRFGWLHTETGLPEAYPELNADTHGEAISFEFIAEVNPDWLLVIDRGAAIGEEGEAAAVTLDNPLIANTTAAKLDQIVYLASGPLYIAGGGYQSMMGTLDELTTAFTR